MKYAIETFNLTKVFPGPGLHFFLRKKTERTVLRDINLQINFAEIFCLMGPNGSGKTTFLKILSTLMLPTSGSAKISGLDIVNEGEKVRRSIGLVTAQERSIYWRLTGRENLEFYAALHGLKPREAVRQIAFVAETLELGGFLDRRVMEYSAGMRQRLCLARGLLNTPKVLFLDEPTKSLDMQAASSLRNLIKKELVQKKGTTVIFSTHQAMEARLLSDRIGLLENGAIKEEVLKG